MVKYITSSVSARIDISPCGDGARRSQTCACGDGARGDRGAPCDGISICNN